MYEEITLYTNADIEITEMYSIGTIANQTFTVIEIPKDNDIEIQNMRRVKSIELANIDGMGNERLANKINEIIRAIKQIDKRIREE